MRGAVQRHPDGDALRREYDTLAEELANLLAERERLLGQHGPALEAEYQLQVGSWQLEVLRLECEVRRLQRRMELFQAARNRGQPIDPKAVERVLDDEFAAWLGRLDAERHALQRAREWLDLPRLSAEEARELRTLFRALAKRLHPDASPEGGPEAEALWLRGETAYRLGNLAELRALTLLADSVPGAVPSGVGALAERRDALRAAAERVRAEIAAIRARFPFAVEVQLADPAWVRRRRAELTQRRDDLADRRELLQAALRARFPEAADG